MKNYLITAPTVAHRPLIDYNDIEEAVIIDEESPKEQQQTNAHVNFLEANTDAISMKDLIRKCVVPTWANQELTVAHQDFVNTIHDAATNFFNGETINEPDIRVSHIVRGRIPSALHKRASELLETEKTQFYQRLAFAFTIPTIYETIQGEKVELCIGGVRNYNDLNLYRNATGVEKFSVFIGWRVNICSNQELSGNGVKLQMEVTSLHDLYLKVMDLLQNFNPASEIHLMQTLSQTYLTETQFAQIIGRMRIYQALPQGYTKRVPQLLITDSQINNVCRGYFTNPEFGAKNEKLSMFDFHNLLTEANKSSYIDSYLQRAVNATEVSIGLNNALHGDSTYQWFLG